MDFRLLGAFEVYHEGRTIDVGAGKQRALLALLLLNANEVVPIERLIDELWGEDPPASVAKIVQIHVSRLRKALERGRNGGDAREVLLTRGRDYLIRVEPGELDVDRFEALSGEGRRALEANDAGEAAGKLREALSLWRGPPLVDFANDSFAQREIARLHEIRLAALEDRIEADLARGRHTDLVAELEGLVNDHPLRERLRGQLMLALYRSGRQAEALDVYREGRRVLLDELGLEPGRALQELERAVLQQEPAIDAPAHRRGPARGTPDRALGRRALPALVVVTLAAAIAVAVFTLSAGGSSRALKSVPPDSVGVIDPDTNKIVATIPVGSTPSRLAIGFDSVWVVNRDDKTVSRIDPKTRTVVKTIVLDGIPSDIAVGEGAVWVLTSARSDPGLGVAPARLVRIDPTYYVRKPISIGAPFGFGACDPVAVGAGAVWVADRGAPGPVTRIDPGKNKAVDRISAGGSGGGAECGLDVGEGSVWVATDGAVVRINPRTDSISARIPTGPTVPVDLAAGEGAIWLASRPDFRCCNVPLEGTGMVRRIGPATNTVVETITLGGTPSAVAVGDGSVWVANSKNRSLARIDPKTGRLIRIKLGNRPRGVLFGYNAVWVSVG
jgi:YVTN family beta-propeller protein